MNIDKLIDKKDIEESLQFIELELEGGNIHDFIELPRKIYDESIEELSLSEGDKLKLAHILTRQFYHSF